MSRLIDKLKQVSQAEHPPMGFRAAQAVSAKPKILLITSWAEASNTGRLVDYTTGAEAVLITKIGSGAKILRKIAQSISDIPWGLWLGDIGSKEIKQMAEAGGDFIVFPASAALALPKDDKIGKI